MDVTKNHKTTPFREKLAIFRSIGNGREKGIRTDIG